MMMTMANVVLLQITGIQNAADLVVLDKIVVLVFAQKLMV